MEPVVPAVSHPDRERPRRRLRLRAGRSGLRHTFLILFFPHLWIGVFFFFGSIFQLARPLIEQPAIGHVVEKHATTSKKGGTTYTVVYDVDHDGVATHASDTVAYDLYVGAVEGGAVDVAVADAFGHRFTRLSGNHGDFAIIGFAAFWNAIVGVFVWLFAGKVWLEWWLLRRGMRVPGQIVVVGPATGQKTKMCAVDIRYVPRGQGVPLEKRLSLTPAIAQALPLRDVVVFHHPRWPGVAVIAEAAAWDVVDASSRVD